MGGAKLVPRLYCPQGDQSLVKIQLYYPGVPYYMFQQGTDSLEQLFSAVRTETHATNFNASELNDIMMILTMCQQITGAKKTQTVHVPPRTSR